MLLRLVWVGILCVWCVTSEKMPKDISNHLIKNETQTQSKAKKEVKAETMVDLKVEQNTRTARQLDPGLWNPIPAMWSPRPRSPLYTWWATPWQNEGPHSLVRIRPPSPYWEDYAHDYLDHYHHDRPHYHHHHHHPPHHDKHHDEHHHNYHDYHPHPHKPLPPPPHYPAPYAGRPGLYIAQTLGSIHIAPLPGHADSVIASNLQPPAGVSVDIPPGISPFVPSRPPPPPPPAPPAPFPRTW